MLEGYITPLLTSYLQKYVKNIKPSDLKLSIWGGDVVLNNLELRLNVLEELVPIPIRFVSGRIRELKIHVPWTALSYEAVVVSIDTIECVLEWNENKHSANSQSASFGDADTAAASAGDKAAQQEAASAAGAPPGYVQGLINKITNNFTLNVTNLVLKYVEDDMVLSVSVPEVDFSPANANWEKEFVDASTMACLLRKLVNVRDMTLCLDGRTESGSIDVYQEPLLYKCSFVCRMLINNDPAEIDHFPLGTSVQVLVERGELSFNDWQLPKFNRFIMHFIDLYKEKLAVLNAVATAGHNMTSSANDEEALAKADSKGASSTADPGQSSGNLDDSWTSWAWTLVGGADDSAKSPVEARANRLQREKRFAVAFFVRHGTVTLKQLHGTQRSSKLRRQRCIGVPWIVVDLHLSTLQIIAEGKHFFDTLLACGSIEASWIRHATEDAEAELFFQLGSVPANSSDFLAESLFKPIVKELVEPGTNVDDSVGAAAADQVATTTANPGTGSAVTTVRHTDVSVDDDKADTKTMLDLYSVRDELKETNTYSALLFDYRYVLPYVDGSVPGQHALEKLAASSGIPPTQPPMAGEGGFGDGIVESSKQRLLVGPTWLLMSDDVLQRVQLFTKPDDKPAGKPQESSVDTSSPDKSAQPVCLPVGGFQRAATVIHATFNKVQILYSCLPAEPLPSPVQMSSSKSQHRPHSATSPAAPPTGPSSLTGSSSSSFKWAPVTPSAKTVPSGVTSGSSSSVFRPRTVLWLDASRIDWQVTRAMYWPRLSRAPPSVLKLAVLPNQCYSENVIKSFGTSGGFAWLENPQSLTRKTCFVQPTTLSIYIRRLLAPDSLVSGLAVESETRIELPRFHAHISLAELILAVRFLRLTSAFGAGTKFSSRERRMAVEALHTHTQSVLALDPDLFRAGQNLIQLVVEGAQMSSYVTQFTNAQSGRVSSAQLSVRQADSQQGVVLAAGPVNTGSVAEGRVFTSRTAAPPGGQQQAAGGDMLAQFTFQQPVQDTAAPVVARGLVLLKVTGTALNCDTGLQTWLISSLDHLHKVYAEDLPTYDSPKRAVSRPRIIRHISQASLSGLSSLGLDESDVDAPAAPAALSPMAAEPSMLPGQTQHADGGDGQSKENTGPASTSDASAPNGVNIPGWMTMLSKAVMQVNVDPIILLWPSDSLSAFQQASPAGDIISAFQLGCFTSQIPHPPLPPSLVFCLPAIQLTSHNLASAGVRLAVEQTLPCLSQVRLENQVDTVPIRQLSEDCLPCAISLTGVSAFTISPHQATAQDQDCLVEVCNILQATGLHVLLAASQNDSQPTSQSHSVFTTPPDFLSPVADNVNADPLLAGAFPGPVTSTPLAASAAAAAAIADAERQQQQKGGTCSAQILPGVVIHGNAEPVCLLVSQKQIQLLQSLAAGWLHVVVSVWQSAPLFTDIPLAHSLPGHRHQSSATSGAVDPAGIHRVTEQYDKLASSSAPDSGAYSVSTDSGVPGAARESSVKSQAGSQQSGTPPVKRAGQQSTTLPVSDTTTTNSRPLSVWIQCTLPLLQVCVRSAQTSFTVSLEDLSASVDASGTDVDGRYLVGDVAVSHQALRSDGKWDSGPWSGVFFTRGSPDIFDTLHTEQDVSPTQDQRPDSLQCREEVKTRAFLSVRYNTKCTLGAHREYDEQRIGAPEGSSPWKGELHVALKPCTIVACCPVLADILHVFQLSADGAECVRHVTSLLPAATRRLKGSGDGLVLPCLFLDVHGITIAVPSVCDVPPDLESTSDTAANADTLVLHLSEVHVGPSPANPIIPLVMEKIIKGDQVCGWRRSLLANQLVCKDIQLEAMLKGLSVAVTPWTTVQLALQSMAAGRQGDLSAEPDSGQVPALEWNKSEPQQRVPSSSAVLVPLLSVPCCQVTIALAWHLSQLTGLLPDSASNIDMTLYRVGNLLEMSMLQLISVHVGHRQLEACLSAWENNIQPLLAVIQKLFLSGSEENVMILTESLPPMSPTEPSPMRRTSSHTTTITTPIELSLTGQGVAFNLSLPDIGTWSASIQQPVLLYANLLSSVVFQLSVHDLKFTVHPSDAQGIVTIVETRRGCSLSRSGVSPSFFKLNCHGKTPTAGDSFAPDGLDVSLGRPVRVSVTVTILDRLALTLRRLQQIVSRSKNDDTVCEEAEQSASAVDMSQDCGKSSFADYATPVDTPSKLQQSWSLGGSAVAAPVPAATAPVRFPVSLSVATAQIVLEVFGADESHVQLVVGTSELQLARLNSTTFPYMSGNVNCVAMSACLVSDSLTSPASACRHRLLLPFAASSELLFWQSPASTMCWNATASCNDVHVLCCQKRVADLQILAQSLLPTVERLLAVSSSQGEVSSSPLCSSATTSSSSIADVRPLMSAMYTSPTEQDQMVRFELAPSGGEGFVMPKTRQVSFWTHHLVNPPRASMTWKYPLPRYVTALDVMPVPWHDSDIASVPAELQVWNAAMARFECVVTFDLFVSSLQQVLVESHLCTAGTTWRVEATCTCSQVEPQLLAACILVHSSVAHIRQASACGSSVKLHLFNAYKDLDAIMPGRPPTVLHPSFPALQQFALLSLEKWSAVHAGDVSTNPRSEPCLVASSNVRLDAVDFSCQQLKQCLSLESLQVSKKQAVDVSVGRCRVDVSGSVLHTLQRSAPLWRISKSAPSLVQPVSIGQSTSNSSTYVASADMKWTSSQEYRAVLLHHYLIVNNTYSALLVGQAETDECITLQPGHTLAYSWRDVHAPRLMQLATLPWPGVVAGVENTHPSNPTKWCEPFGIDKSKRLARWVLAGAEGQEYLDDPARVTVDVGAMTSVQRVVLIRGSAHFGNYLPKDVQVGWWFRSREVQQKLDDVAGQRKSEPTPEFAEEIEQDKKESKLARELNVAAQTSSLSWIVPQSCVLVVKLRFTGAKSWSGGVPFQVLPDGHQFQTMAIPTGLKWPLLQIYFHMRVVNHVSGALPLYGSVSPLMQVRNHMPNWIAVHMSRVSSSDAPFSAWVPPAGGQLFVSHLGSQDCYDTAFQMKGLDYMSPANLPLTCELRQDLPSVQPKSTIDVRLITPEQRAEDGLQSQWPHIHLPGPESTAIAKVATTAYPHDQHMLKYIDLTVGPPKPVMVVDGDEPVADVEDTSDHASTAAGGDEKKFPTHYGCCGVVSVHRKNFEMETLQVELAPWCLVVNRTPRVVLLSLGRNNTVTIPPQHVLVPPNFNWGFHVGVQVDGVNVWSRHLISLQHRQAPANDSAESRSATVKTLVNEEQYRKLVFHGEEKRSTMVVYTCSRFGTQTVVLTEHFAIVNQTGRKLLVWSAYHRDLVCQASPVCVQPDEDICTALAPSPASDEHEPDPAGPYISVAVAEDDEHGRTKLPVPFNVDTCSAPIALGNEILRQPFGVPIPQLNPQSHGEPSSSHSDTQSSSITALDDRQQGVARGMRDSLPLVVCVQPHQGTNYTAIAVDSAPQFVIENRCFIPILCQEVDKSEKVGGPLRVPSRCSLHWQPFSALAHYPSAVTAATRPSIHVHFQFEGESKHTAVIDVTRSSVVRTAIGYVQVVHGEASCLRIIVSLTAPPDTRKAAAQQQDVLAREQVKLGVQELCVVVHDGPSVDPSPSIGLCLRNLACKVMSQSCGTRSVNLTIGYVQAENLRKSEDVDFPVVLARQVDPISERARQHMPASPGSQDANTVFIGLELTSDNFPSRLVVQLPRLVVHVEDALLAQLTALKDFANIAVSPHEDRSADAPLKQVSLCGLPAPLAKAMPTALHPLRIGEWSVSQIHISLTMHTSRKVFVSIDQSPLRLEAFRLWPGLSSPVTLLETASLHYISLALSSLGWLVSSLELLGSPGGLVRNVGYGVRDLVQLPYQGLSQGPSSFLNGLSGGTTSLLRHLSAGVLTSLSHFAESAARNLDNLSLDKQHAEQQQKMRRRGNDVGLRTGLHSLGMAWLGAIAGLAAHPLQPFMHTDSSAAGASGRTSSSSSSDQSSAVATAAQGSSGSVAMVTGGLKMMGSSLVGVGRGLVGVVTKPVSGAMDLIAHTGHGILSSMELIALLQPQMLAPPILTSCSSFQRMLQHCLLEDIIWFCPCDVTFITGMIPLPATAASVGESSSSNSTAASSPESANILPLSRHQCILLLSPSNVRLISTDEGLRETHSWTYNLCDVEFRDFPCSALPSPGRGGGMAEEVDVCLLPLSESTTTLLAGVSTAAPQAHSHSDCLCHITLPSPLAAKLLFTFVVVLSKQHHFYIS
ncbi:uncharacterized protein LOC135808631 [Sycon ciliatum]|uniref:uncharacterized protein LOC135808631 n=1 Tax=Sycon ciliatum TaxID=27933 RepID=UPI0031F6F7D3